MPVTTELHKQKNGIHLLLNRFDCTLKNTNTPVSTCCAAIHLHISLKLTFFNRKLTYTESRQYTHCTLPRAYQGINICPVQAIVSNIKINGQSFLDAFQWHTFHSVR